MKKLTVCFLTIFMLVNVNAFSADDRSLLEKILRKDLPGGVASEAKKSKDIIIEKGITAEKNVALKTNKTKQVSAIPSVNNISLYTGTFDVIDKEGDDQSSLFGVEHKNPNLFRNTFLGKFSPITGAFMTGNSSVYIYTGIEGQYGIGPLKILPSFSPGYYEKGDGKDLGNVLEFKSEIKIGLDLFENSQLGYSYSHISNNDWGDTNPGTDNQQITFSKNF
jgi:lipid A 3-O-deacylase